MYRYTALSGLAVLALGASAFGATITTTTVLTAKSDNTVSQQAISYGSEWAGRVSPSPAVAGAAIFVFQLPTLAAGETLADVTFSVTSVSTNGSGGNPAVATINADLYGVRWSASSAVASSDYYGGALDATKTLLQDNFATPYTPATTATTFASSAGGSSSLTSYLNSLYTSGAAGGNYVFLRLSPDGADLTANVATRYQFATQANVTESYRPALTYSVTAVPEPAALGLLLSAGAILVRRRRSA